MNDFENWSDDPRSRRRHGRRGHGGPEGFGPGPGFGFGGPFGPFGPGPFGPGGPMGGRGRTGRRGQVRTSILALLSEQPLNGYQIMQTLGERTEGAWKPSPGAVYPALAQLEDEGLIEAFDNEGQKAFRLTDAGRDAAAAIQTTPWEAVNAALSGERPDQMRALWREFKSLASALTEISRNGELAQLEAATTLVTQTRRRLYGILAEDADPEMPNPDDLR